MAASGDEEADAQEPRLSDTKERSQRFRFKRKHSEKTPAHDEDDVEEGRNHNHRHHRHQHHRSSRHHHRHKRSKGHVKTGDSIPGLSSDTAFRESLFDALGDDEGAAFWQGVYGQPIHTFPKTYEDAATGELEQMNDEEYTQYVRRRMWEKSWEGIEAAKEAKRQEREREKQERHRQERAQQSRDKSSRTARVVDPIFDLDIEQSLRRGERRREKKRWTALWNDYLSNWERLDTLCRSTTTIDEREQVSLRDEIVWPVESGKRTDVKFTEVERFIEHCAAVSDEGNSDAVLKTVLKSERVRWHPDKIQQRYGSIGIDEGTLKTVTAVFQILDRMWNDHRAKD